jgi:hypothetical protein
MHLHTRREMGKPDRCAEHLRRGSGAIELAAARAACSAHARFWITSTAASAPE